MNIIFTLLLKVNLLKQKTFKFTTVNLLGIHLFAVKLIKINVVLSNIYSLHKMQDATNIFTIIIVFYKLTS